MLVASSGERLTTYAISTGNVCDIKPCFEGSCEPVVSSSPPASSVSPYNPWPDESNDFSCACTVPEWLGKQCEYACEPPTPARIISQLDNTSVVEIAPGLGGFPTG